MVGYIYNSVVFANKIKHGFYYRYACKFYEVKNNEKNIIKCVFKSKTFYYKNYKVLFCF